MLHDRVCNKLKTQKQKQQHNSSMQMTILSPFPKFPFAFFTHKSVFSLKP